MLRSGASLISMIKKNSEISPLIFHKRIATKATFTVEKPFKLFLLEMGPDTKVSLTKEEALKYYEQMFFIRRAEQKCSELYKNREIRGFCHLYSGQEAVAVGMKAAMRDTDSLITSYRCHAWTYLLGIPLEAMLAELTGRVTGCSRGKGGSMHMYGKNFFGGNGIVGAQVPLGVGSGFAHKYKNDKGVCFALYGDGAANQGQVFEAYNLAKLFSLPVVFVCENNLYSMGTSVPRSTATPDYYKRGCYIPGIWVDGMDILAVRESTRFAIAHILAGKGPILVEHETYRYFGHSMSDPGTSYRTREEVQKIRSTRDPIIKFKEKIIKENLASEDELKKIEKKCTKNIDDIEHKIKKDPFPPMDEMTADIYSKQLVKEVRGISPYTPLQHRTLGKPINI